VIRVLAAQGATLANGVAFCSTRHPLQVRIPWDTLPVIEIRRTADFAVWLDSVEEGARSRVLTRIKRARQGNLGDVTPIGGRVSELRIHYGPGYRVYFVHRGPSAVVLLFGGTKKTQERDIARARSLARHV
jgi:putative addiction module killer protein